MYKLIMNNKKMEKNMDANNKKTTVDLMEIRLRHWELKQKNLPVWQIKTKIQKEFGNAGKIYTDKEVK